MPSGRRGGGARAPPPAVRRKFTFRSRGRRRPARRRSYDRGVGHAPRGSSGLRLGAAAPAALLAVLGAACLQQAAGTGLAGTVTVDGSSTVFPITQAMAEEFVREEPGVQVSVGVSGTGGGFQKLCSGEIDIADASRPIKESEREDCRRRGIEWLELPVALDGISIATHPDNTFVDCLTVEELERIWRPDSDVERWDQIRPGFPREGLALYGPGTDSGTFDFFTEAIVGESGASRTDYTASEDDNILVLGIAGDPRGLGYFGFAFFDENRGLLRGLAVDGGDGCVPPTRETIASNAYAPLSRPIFVYVARSSARRPAVRAFVDFYLEHVELVDDVGYVPLPPERLAATLRQWEEFAS